MAPLTRSHGARQPVDARHKSSAQVTSGQDKNLIDRAKRGRVRQQPAKRLASHKEDALPPVSCPQSGGQRKRNGFPDKPPRFTIDLSLPPSQRYFEVCAEFKNEMRDLTSLFGEVVQDMVPFLSLKWLHSLCTIFLRRVYTTEENEELKGISKATGVEMYLLVCFNVFLDLFMGCSSGGAVVRNSETAGSDDKMVHFRTLDWDMPELRRTVVHLEYVLEKDGPVIASSITYAGFVGVLTGVRPGLSLSLNFRPNRIDSGNYWSDAMYFLHMLLVLLGLRPSISSILRSMLLPQGTPRTHRAVGKLNIPTYRSFSEIIARLGGTHTRCVITSACYLCFCNGKETVVVEKDRISSRIRSSKEFIVVTNTDSDAPANQSRPYSRKR